MYEGLYLLCVAFCVGDHLRMKLDHLSHHMSMRAQRDGAQVLRCCTCCSKSRALARDAASSAAAAASSSCMSA